MGQSQPKSAKAIHRLQKQKSNESIREWRSAAGGLADDVIEAERWESNRKIPTKWTVFNTQDAIRGIRTRPIWWIGGC